MEQFVATVALIGLVIIVASLLSSVVERLAFPLVGAFLLLGLVVGPHGMGIRDFSLRSPELMVLSTLGLALVLFSDAVGVNIREVRAHRRLAWVVLLPGTIFPALLIGFAAYWLLEVPLAGAAILGAALASTDPVLLRTVLRAPTLAPTARVGLRIESGMNDVLLLPIVVVAMLSIGAGHGGAIPGLGRHLVGLFLLGPALGALVGWVGITLLDVVRSRIGVRRDYESLYAIGIGFAAYAVAEFAGGSGFLAAFAAGIAIAALDIELCDCFLEYGEATSEMLLLLTFVALGTSLIWSGLAIADIRALAFAIVALTTRTAVLYPALAYVGVRGADRDLIAWFGPRGLSSLLLVLLPVFANVPGAERWFQVTSLVVLLSLVGHGAIIGVFLRRRSRQRLPVESPLAPRSADVERTSEPRTTATNANDERITIAEVRAMQQGGDPVAFVDARAARSYDADDRQIVGSVRIPPVDPVRSATERQLSQRSTLVVYCA